MRNQRYSVVKHFRKRLHLSTFGYQTKLYFRYSLNYLQQLVLQNTRFRPCPFHCSLLPTYLTARFSPALKWFKKTIENDRSCETSGHFLQNNQDTFYPWLKLRINSWIKFWNFRKIWKLLFLISWDNSEPTLPAITCLKV